jgi:DmsE family decaheme c-type cytochrome
MTIIPAVVFVRAVLGATLLAASLFPLSASAGVEASQQAVRTCTTCHNENSSTTVLSIYQTKHAMTADKRTPFADQACMTCHGQSEKHAKGLGPPDIGFGDKAAASATEKNAVCLGCHESGKSGLRMHWKGSAHETQDVTCASCHNLHAAKDKVRSKITQPEVCSTCHKEKRSEMMRPSSHPIREGKTACSDCHNPHGSTGPKLLVKGTVNETCYTCHAEKRGPFLWEHAPVREDCTICHQPHGSVHSSLLKQRGPWLCQQCHLAPQHPSTAYSGTGLPGATKPSGAQQMLGKNCLNCHSQVHGSNHPSGVRKTR